MSERNRRSPPAAPFGGDLQPGHDDGDRTLRDARKVGTYGPAKPVDESSSSSEGGNSVKSAVHFC